MPHPTSVFPRGTNQYPDTLDLPFNPIGNGPFAAETLGALMNTGSVADPTAAAFRYLLSAAAHNPNSDSSNGSMNPVVNPSDLAVGYYWWTPLPMADICRITPYLIKYSSSAHTALATAAAANAIGATYSFWTTHERGAPVAGKVKTYRARFIGAVAVTNAAARVNASSPDIPLGAQFCDVASVSLDKSLSPGIRIAGDGTGGALDILFDQQGGSGLIVQVSSITASCGAGWLRGHI